MKLYIACIAGFIVSILLRIQYELSKNIYVLCLTMLVVFCVVLNNVIQEDL